MSQAGRFSSGSGPGGIITIDGDTGFATGPTINLVTGFVTGPYANGTIEFVGDNATTITLQSTDGLNNTALGSFALGSTTAAQQNCAFGSGAGFGMTAGNNNCLFGVSAGASLNVSQDCVAIGFSSLSALAPVNPTDARWNIAIGSDAGSNLLTTGSSNIYMNNNAFGADGESNTLRFGSATGSAAFNLSRAFICGIDGVNVGSVANVVTVNNDQLGSAVITAGTGVTVTPGANTITIGTSGAIADTFHTDAGDAVPAAGILNIEGDSASITTSGSGNTVVIHYTPFIRTVNTTPYNAVLIDYYLAVDASGSPITINLPNTTTTGRIFIVKDYLGQANINNINITTPGGTVLFDGFTLYTLNAQYQSANFIFDGTNYQIW